MLDRALSKTFAELSTLVLLACVLTLPIHVIHAFVFKDALAVAELGPEIRAFPEGRQVRGVAKEDLDRERTTLLILLGAQILAVPLVYRAAKRAIAVSDEGAIPTVTDAWSHLGSSSRPAFSPGPVAVAAIIGGVGGWLIWLIGATLADMTSADLAWAVTGLTRGFSIGVAMALACGVAASLPQQGRKAAKVPEKIDLY